MELGLQGKVALVTGASRGIGRATALELAREGCDIVAAARTAEQLAELADEIRRKYNRRVTTDAADLRDSENVRRLVDAAASEFGRIDIVVNNAGATKRGDFFVLEDADFLDGFALKFHGYVRVTRAAWPHLRKSNGAIVNIIGAGGRTASPDFTIGGSVNAALFNFTKATAQIGIRDGVRVNAINPGSVETDRLKGRIANVAKEQGVDEEEARKRYLAQLGVARFGKPEEIGQLVCFLASPLAANFQGALVDCDSGSTRSI
jgi:NAD(P)-dependent dehydrogenase (short-subunit alcohol dehydrogenase family)